MQLYCEFYYMHAYGLFEENEKEWSTTFFFASTRCSKSEVGKTFLLFDGAANVSTTARLESKPLRPNFEAPPQVGSQIGLAVG